MTGNFHKDPSEDLVILGLMSGSSLDGLDLALCRFSGFGESPEWQIIRAETIPYSPEWRERLRLLPQANAREFVQADHDFGHLLGSHSREFLGDDPVDCIASHGHTVFHFPEQRAGAQIGKGSAIAAVTGFPVICDFRSSDLALGGQGAPLVAVFDRHLFGDIEWLLNLGGIANLSLNLSDHTLAFDICPCNQWLNYLASMAGMPFDQGGRLASRGKTNQALMSALLEDPYFNRQAPKTLDNSYVIQRFFPLLDSFSIQVEDKLNTACETIAFLVAESMKKLLVPFQLAKSNLLITGGGAHNLFLVNRIRKYVEELTIRETNAIFIDYKESLMMAYLAYLWIRRKNNVLSSATGASRNSLGGAYYPGKIT